MDDSSSGMSSIHQISKAYLPIPEDHFSGLWVRAFILCVFACRVCTKILFFLSCWAAGGKQYFGGWTVILCPWFYFKIWFFSMILLIGFFIWFDFYFCFEADGQVVKNNFGGCPVNLSYSVPLNCMGWRTSDSTIL